MTDWKWTNEPHGGRLRVLDVADNIVMFVDGELGESVKVTVPDDLSAVQMTVATRDDYHSIARSDAKHYLKGRFIAARDVWHYVTRQHATALRAGLTVHRSAFSSTPHEFEKTPEKGFEEAFWFLLPDGGKALLEGDGLWPDGTAVDAAWPVRDRQLAQVPMGWHRVVALADASGRVPKVAYVWCYLCTRPEWEKD